MGQLTITLPDGLEAEIREFVRKEGYDSVSDFIREKIAYSIAGRPTYWERVMLVHLIEIKEKLGDSVGDVLLDALRSGYPKYYSFEGHHVDKNEMSIEDMEFIEDILLMYGDLQYSYDKSKKKDPNIRNRILFEGFDGNSGDGFLSYVHFLVTHDRYTFVKPLDKGEPIHSYMPMTSIYERMLVKYKSIKKNVVDNRPLTLDEISAVIQEQTHPSKKGKLHGSNDKRSDSKPPKTE